MPKLLPERVAAKKAAFLEGLREFGTVRHAAAKANVTRAALYNWREQDEDFARQWEAALEDNTEALEESAFQRALKGDTVLTIFLLKGRRPHVYRDNARVEVVNTSSAAAVAAMSGEQLRALFQEATAALSAGEPVEEQEPSEPQ